MPSIKQINVHGTLYDIKTKNLTYLYVTEAPTEDNPDDGLRVVVLEEEPEVKYNGYLYFITKSNEEEPEIELDKFYLNEFDITKLVEAW